MKRRLEVLMYADSESDPDQFYFGGVYVPDPYLAFSSSGKRVAVVGQLEFARMSKESKYDEVLMLEDCTRKARTEFGAKVALPAGVLALLARRMGISAFAVGGNFPLGLARDLEALSIRLEVQKGMLFPEREYKSAAEAAHIRAGNAASVAGFKVVEKILRAAEIRKGHLYYAGRRLTSEFLQAEIGKVCLECGAFAAHTIVAGGDQACDPHCRGSGPLSADSLIIVDIFPRVQKTGYHGDMTRTYLKGRASEAQKRLVATVLEAQQAAIPNHRKSCSAEKIYRSVCDRFAAAGYETKVENGQPSGFFHGLGHGLGLAVHEPPRVSASGTRLRCGQVITVEPGLYYPGLGGVRFEDVIRVTDAEPELLSAHPYRWLLP